MLSRALSSNIGVIKHQILFQYDNKYDTNEEMLYMCVCIYVCVCDAVICSDLMHALNVFISWRHLFIYLSN